MKKVSKSIQNRINKINDLIPFVNKSEDLACDNNKSLQQFNQKSTLI